jgi:hypothetical protein
MANEKEKFEALPHEGRCGAKTRTGEPCRQWLVPGRSRCHYHGGKSTGPRTPEGLERMRKANTVHGAYSRENIELRRVARAMHEGNQALLSRLKELALTNPHAFINSGITPHEALSASDLGFLDSCPDLEANLENEDPEIPDVAASPFLSALDLGDLGIPHISDADFEAVCVSPEQVEILKTVYGRHQAAVEHEAQKLKSKRRNPRK